MAGTGDFTDRCDDLFVIDDASAVLSGKGVGCHKVDRNANSLPTLPLGCADPDAAHQDEPAYGDRVAGAFCLDCGMGVGRAALNHFYGLASASWFGPATLRHCARAVRSIGGEAGKRQSCKLFGDFLHAEAPLRIVPFIEPVQHSQQAVRGHLNVQVRTKLAALDALAKDLLPAALIFLGRKPDLFAKSALHGLAL